MKELHRWCRKGAKRKSECGWDSVHGGGMRRRAHHQQLRCSRLTIRDFSGEEAKADGDAAAAHQQRGGHKGGGDDMMHGVLHA